MAHIDKTLTGLHALNASGACGVAAVLTVERRQNVQTVCGPQRSAW